MLTPSGAATFRPEIEIQGRRTRVLAEQASAVDPSGLGECVGHLAFDELRAVDAALRLVMSLQRNAEVLQSAFRS